MGIVGLETAFPLLYTNLVKEGIISLEKLIELMCINPRKRFNIPNSGYCVWDLNCKYKIDTDDFRSMGRSTPFEGEGGLWKMHYDNIRRRCSMENLKKLVLEDGSSFTGNGFGYDCERVCELVFNTSMVGYQEIMSDPAYTDQAVLMTYPLIGNYGVTDEDFETKTPTLGALIVREYNDIPSNFRYTRTLSEVMEEYHIPGLWGIDTRKLARSIRDLGSRRAIITDANVSTEEAVKKISETPVPHDAVLRVSSKKRWYSKTASAKYNVVLIDCGLRLSTLHALNARGCNITVVPHDTVQPT